MHFQNKILYVQLDNKYMETKEIFKPGDLVILKHKELNSPIMLVVSKVYNSPLKHNINNYSDIYLLGIKCIWFDKQQKLQSYIFSTKDIILYNK